MLGHNDFNLAFLGLDARRPSSKSVPGDVGSPETLQAAKACG